VLQFRAAESGAAAPFARLGTTELPFVFKDSLGWQNDLTEVFILLERVFGSS